MFASKSVKKVRKFISNIFFSEVSTSVKDVDDDGDEDVRILSRSTTDDGEDVDDVDDNDHDDNKSDGDSADDDNNEGNNDADTKTYGVGKSLRVGAIS